jgi:hypothetical protein
MISDLALQYRFLGSITRVSGTFGGDLGTVALRMFRAALAKIGWERDSPESSVTYLLFVARRTSRATRSTLALASRRKTATPKLVTFGSVAPAKKPDAH